MSDAINYTNNPLHGVGLKSVVTELVEQYGFEILYAYLQINCFKTNPSIASSVKFLKKTDWAREKVEVFYLYQYKNLPRASSEQFKLPPRERIIPDNQVPGEPVELSLEDAERLREKKQKKAAAWKQSDGYRSRKRTSAPRSKPSSHRTSDEQPQRKPDAEKKKSSEQRSDSDSKGFNPWGKWEKK